MKWGSIVFGAVALIAVILIWKNYSKFQAAGQSRQNALDDILK